VLTKDYKYPNGICLSPDEKTLYIANTDDALPIIGAHELKADGTIGPRKVFFDQKPLVDPKLPGLCDGIKADKDGNIFAGGLGGMVVLSPAGKVLGHVYTGEQSSNVAWGDDGSMIYITSDYFVVRVKTKTKGAGW